MKIASHLAACLLTASALAEPYLVYVSNERSGDITVIDGATDQVRHTIPAGKRPRGIHCSPDGRTIYVALSGSPRMGPGVDAARAAAPAADKAADGIGVIDAATYQFLRKLEAGSDPEQFAVSPDGKRLFVANEDIGKLSVLDAASGKKLAESDVSEEPEGVGVNPVTGEIYVTCEEHGEVYIFADPAVPAVSHFKVGGRPRSVAFLPDGSKAFVPSEAEAIVSVIDCHAKQEIGSIWVGTGTLPMGAVLSSNAKELYVTTGRANSVVVIDTGTGKVNQTIPVGQRPWGLAISPDGKKVYTANGMSNDVSVIDSATKTELTRIKVGQGPWGIAIGPALSAH